MACRDILPEITSKAIVQYLTYYTTLTGLAVAGCFTSFALHKSPKSAIAEPGALTSLAINIFLVMVIYNGFLRPLWEPQGLEILTDLSLHVFIPIGFIVFWFFSVPKNDIAWSQIWKGLRIPFSYLLFTFFRGFSTGYYPYPFLNAEINGYPFALQNAFLLLFLVVAIHVIIILIFKRKPMEPTLAEEKS